MTPNYRDNTFLAQPDISREQILNRWHTRAHTLMRTISSGMFIMALVSQLSRPFAKLRIAWVKAPGVDDDGDRHRE